MYIHCRGGHGRSGLVCACLLIRVGHSADKALELVSVAHHTRSNLPTFPCPQTGAQVEFVKQFKANTYKLNEF